MGARVAIDVSGASFAPIGHGRATGRYQWRDRALRNASSKHIARTGQGHSGVRISTSLSCNSGWEMTLIGHFRAGREIGRDPPNSPSPGFMTWLGIFDRPFLSFPPSNPKRNTTEQNKKRNLTEATHHQPKD